MSSYVTSATGNCAKLYQNCNTADMPWLEMNPMPLPSLSRIPNTIAWALMLENLMRDEIRVISVSSSNLLTWPSVSSCDTLKKEVKHLSLGPEPQIDRWQLVNHVLGMSAIEGPGNNTKWQGRPGLLVVCFHQEIQKYHEMASVFRRIISCGIQSHPL